MSTSLLYHTCGIRGYEYRSTEFVCGTTFVHIGQAREKLRCPQCGREEVSARGSNQRVFRSVPIGSKPVSIVLDVARVYCPKCDATRQVQVGFADEYRRHTRAFARYAVELTGMATIQDVANHLCVGWDLIKELKKSDLPRRYRKPKLRRLKHLAVDEICIGRGRALPNAGARSRHGRDRVCRAGKGADALKPFWKRLQASRARIQAVAADLSRAYTKAVRENLPQGRVVYDRFHVVKLFNEKLSDLRRELHREATDQLEKQVLKGTRWLLLKNPENLDDAKGERRRLEEALSLNVPRSGEGLPPQRGPAAILGAIRPPGGGALPHALDPQSRRFRHSHAQGLCYSGRWRSIAVDSGAWYRYPISTGPLEGTNNKIRALTRQAYGFRDTEFFILRLYGLHETQFRLVG